MARILLFTITCLLTFNSFADIEDNQIKANSVIRASDLNFKFTELKNLIQTKGTIPVPVFSTFQTGNLISKTEILNELSKIEIVNISSVNLGADINSSSLNNAFNIVKNQVESFVPNTPAPPIVPLITEDMCTLNFAETNPSEFAETFSGLSLTNAKQLEFQEYKIIKTAPSSSHFYTLLTDGSLRAYTSQGEDSIIQEELNNSGIGYGLTGGVRVVDVASTPYYNIALLENGEIKIFGDPNSYFNSMDKMYINFISQIKPVEKVYGNKNYSSVLIQYSNDLELLLPSGSNYDKQTISLTAENPIKKVVDSKETFFIFFEDGSVSVLSLNSTLNLLKSTLASFRNNNPIIDAIADSSTGYFLLQDGSVMKSSYSYDLEPALSTFDPENPAIEITKDFYNNGQVYAIMKDKTIRQLDSYSESQSEFIQGITNVKKIYSYSGLLVIHQDGSVRFYSEHGTYPEFQLHLNNKGIGEGLTGGVKVKEILFSSSTPIALLEDNRVIPLDPLNGYYGVSGLLSVFDYLNFQPNEIKQAISNYYGISLLKNDGKILIVDHNFMYYKEQLEPYFNGLGFGTSSFLKEDANTCLIKSCNTGFHTSLDRKSCIEYQEMIGGIPLNGYFAEYNTEITSCSASSPCDGVGTKETAISKCLKSTNGVVEEVSLEFCDSLPQEKTVSCNSPQGGKYEYGPNSEWWIAFSCEEGSMDKKVNSYYCPEGYVLNQNSCSPNPSLCSMETINNNPSLFAQLFPNINMDNAESVVSSGIKQVKTAFLQSVSSVESNSSSLHDPDIHDFGITMLTHDKKIKTLFGGVSPEKKMLQLFDYQSLSGRAEEMLEISVFRTNNSIEFLGFADGVYASYPIDMSSIKSIEPLTLNYLHKNHPLTYETIGDNKLSLVIKSAWYTEGGTAHGYRSHIAVINNDGSADILYKTEGQFYTQHIEYSAPIKKVLRYSHYTFLVWKEDNSLTFIRQENIPSSKFSEENTTVSTMNSQYLNYIVNKYPNEIIENIVVNMSGHVLLFMNNGKIRLITEDPYYQIDRNRQDEYLDNLTLESPIQQILANQSNYSLILTVSGDIIPVGTLPLTLVSSTDCTYVGNQCVSPSLDLKKSYSFNNLDFPNSNYYISQPEYYSLRPYSHTGSYHMILENTDFISRTNPYIFATDIRYPYIKTNSNTIETAYPFLDITINNILNPALQSRAISNFDNNLMLVSLEDGSFLYGDVIGRKYPSEYGLLSSYKEYNLGSTMKTHYSSPWKDKNIIELNNGNFVFIGKNAQDEIDFNNLINDGSTPVCRIASCQNGFKIAPDEMSCIPE